MNRNVVYEERYEYEKGFAAYFAQRIIPALRSLERLRKSVLVFLGLAIATFLIAFRNLLAYDVSHTQLGERGNASVLFWYALFLLLIAIFLGWRYKKHAKGKLAPLILDFFGGMEFKPNAGLSTKKMSGSGLLPPFDAYSAEDYILARKTETPDKEAPVAFECCEVTLMNITKVEQPVADDTPPSPPETRRDIVFHGAFLSIPLMRTITHPVYVFPTRKFFRRTVGDELLTPSVRKGKNHQIKLEDPVFQKMFKAYSADEIESRRILQPALMVRLIQLGELFRHWGKNPAKLPPEVQPDSLPPIAQLTGTRANFSASFVGETLSIMVSCPRDMFETSSLFTSVYNINGIRCFLYQVHLIRLIVTELEKFPQLR